MVAARYQIVCQPGADLEVDWIFRRPGNTGLQPLHGLTAHLGIKRYLADSGAAIAEWGSDTGELTIFPNEGKVELRVPGAVTANIAESGEYDLFFQDSAGEAERVLWGQFVLDN